MTLLCAPQDADLSETNLGTHKVLKDRQGAIRFIDVDWKAPTVSGAPLIISYHNFEETPLDLEEVLSTLKKRGAALYKIATMAHSTLDAMRMLEFIRDHPNVIGLCMGKLGQITRILSPVFGTPIIYASAGEAGILGQLSLQTLHCLYRFKNLNSSTQLFGLIGDPVDPSIGHLFHNSLFCEENQNSVYVKMHVKPPELFSFLSYAKRLKFKGLSVTMPLKEEVMRYLDEIDPEAKAIGAVNTLLFQEGKIKGFNTDGRGALAALNTILKNVKNKRVVLIGAGGSSKAIAHVLKMEGAHVVVANRTRKEGSLSLSEIPNNYDILINATPHPLPIDPVKIIPRSAVMDLSIKETTLLQVSRAKGCLSISGSFIYFQQALLQRELWGAGCQNL